MRDSMSQFHPDGHEQLETSPVFYGASLTLLNPSKNILAETVTI